MPCAYLSAKFTESQQSWEISCKEICAGIQVLRKWKRLILGCEITLQTDSQVFSNLLRMKNWSQQLARWVTTLTEFSVKIEHIAGRNNVHADMLSRKCTDETAVRGRIICSYESPCQKCMPARI